ncbi:MAG: DMT family transporter [Proteobacteria bacterium]|nr:DMT family transporter [Pseudomonadota bacterium]
MLLQSLRSAIRAIPGPARGALWMVIAAAGFGATNVFIRVLAADLPPLEIVFFRNFFGLAFMLPWLAHAGVSALRSDAHHLYAGRAFVGLLSMVSWFTALTLMPLAEATAVSFTSPLFATVAAVLVLGEIVRARRWTATIVGFIGAMIVLHPGTAAFGWAQLLVLCSAAASGFNSILIKQLTRRDSANTIVTMLTLYLTPMSLVPALFVWTWPGLHDAPWIVALGMFATLSHLALTRAFAAADASAIMPFDFTRLPFIALVGWLAFDETPDIWTWVGAAIIGVSSAYIVKREATIARLERAATPSKVAPAATNEAAGTGVVGVRDRAAVAVTRNAAID